ncbi:MAG: lysostaphin resistance A-like protein [Thermoplasmatota archaeon]
MDAEPIAATGERRNPAKGWDALIITDFVLVGLLLIGGLIAYFEGIEGGEISKSALALNMAINLAIFGLIPLAWVWKTRVDWDNIKAYFQTGPAEGVIWGVGLGMVCVIGMAALLATLQALGLNLEAPGNEAIAEAVDWKLALLVAAVAGFSEEILFRGVLQNMIGVVPQAVLFGLAHAGAGHWVAMLATGLLGLLFGSLRSRIGLYGLMAAHFTYNLILFAIQLVYG